MTIKRKHIREEIKVLKGRDPHWNFNILEETKESYKVEIQWTNEDKEIIMIRPL